MRTRIRSFVLSGSPVTGCWEQARQKARDHKDTRVSNRTTLYVRMYGTTSSRSNTEPSRVHTGVWGGGPKVHGQA